MVSADEPPFWWAAQADPADDRPRLLYADFLDDAGHPARADLVRLQLAFARLPDDHPARPALAARLADLAPRQSAAVAAQLDGLVAGVAFRRGLPDSVTLDAGTFVARGPDLFDRLPVRRVRLLDAGRVPDALAGCPHLARVPELDLCGNDLGDDGLGTLLRSPFLRAVETLDLGFNGLTDRGAGYLARVSTLPALRHLSLNDNRELTADGLDDVARSPFLAGLRSLDLSGNEVGDAGVEVLTRSATLGRLSAVNLSNAQVGDGGVRALAGSALFGRMVRRRPVVSLRANRVGPGGVQALLSSAAVGALVALDLTDNRLADRGAGLLARSSALDRLRCLRLGRNRIADPGARSLAAAPWLAGLRTLDVSGNYLTRRGVDALAGTLTGAGTVLDATGNVVVDPAPVALGEAVGEVLGGIRRECQR